MRNQQLQAIIVKSDDIGKLVEGLVASMQGKGKTTIKIQIEITNE